MQVLLDFLAQVANPVRSDANHSDRLASAAGLLSDRELSRCLDWIQDLQDALESEQESRDAEKE